MLPIGSIVYLKEGTNKLMILNRGPIIEQSGEQTLFDYSGCFYPQGIDPDNVFYFNQENIDKVIFKGFSDGDEERFQELFQEWMDSNKENIKKGKVENPLK